MSGFGCCGIRRRKGTEAAGSAALNHEDIHALCLLLLLLPLGLTGCAVKAAYELIADEAADSPTILIEFVSHKLRGQTLV